MLKLKTGHKLLILTMVVIAVFAIIIFSKTDSFIDQKSTHLLFLEEFSGNNLSSKWEIVKNLNGTIAISDGILELKEGTHKRVNSSFEIFHSNSTLELTGKVKFTGYYQKFGININAENILNAAGIYFDTFCPQDYSCNAANTPLVDGEDRVHLMIKENNIDLFETRARIRYGEFHELKIVVSPADVNFFIDNNLVGISRHKFTGSITIGVWNDRSADMQVDWIKVEQG